MARKEIIYVLLKSRQNLTEKFIKFKDKFICEIHTIGDLTNC